MRLRRGTPAQFQDVEQAEYSFYVSTIRSGMTVFDVGANVGELTTLFSRFVYPGGRVVAFEPVPETFARLRAVQEAVGRDNATLVEAAVSDTAGDAVMHVYDEKHLSWSTFADRPLGELGLDPAGIRDRTVRTVRLDDYCGEHEIDRIDVLKIDVEGAELQALRGAGQLFAEGRIGHCVFEYGGATHDMGVTAVELRDFFAASGYGVRNLVAGDPAFPRSEHEPAIFSMHVASRR